MRQEERQTAVKPAFHLDRLVGNVERIGPTSARVELDTADPASSGQSCQKEVPLAAFRPFPLDGDRVILWQDTETLIVCRAQVLPAHSSRAAFRVYVASNQCGEWRYGNAES